MTGMPEAEVGDPERMVRDGLRCLQLSGAIFFRACWSAPWAYESPSVAAVRQMLDAGDRRIILFHIFTEGSCRLELSRGGGVDLAAGDIVIFPFADQHSIGDPDASDPVPIGELMPPLPWKELPVVEHGGGGRPAAMVCGYLYCDDLPINPVLDTLPRVIKIRPSGGPLARWVEASVEYALHASERHADDDPVLRRLPELLLTECLCDHAARTAPEARGWLAALGDPVVGRALACMHREPERGWTLEELSRRAATSRSVLDERFRHLLGQAPMSYLTSWRLQLAARQLRTSNATLAEVAESVGYGSEAAFSRAFKRHTGRSPGEWRTHESG